MEKNSNLNYDRPVEIAKGIFWIGFYDEDTGLHCNPYLIIDGNEAVVIDGGSRPDFPTVMMKILQTGISVSSISALIYQHYDPDLCGSIPDFEYTIDKDDLKIISHTENNMFIRHYAVSSKLISLSQIEYCFTFSSGRQLEFIHTPYSHSPGSFVSFDKTSGILFTSDLFGSYGTNWKLFLKLYKECRLCKDLPRCPHKDRFCPMKGINNFHKRIMTSEAALKYALETISEYPFTMIAPQHGSVIASLEAIITVFQHLYQLKDIGINDVLNKIKKRPPGIDHLLKRETTNGNI